MTQSEQQQSTQPAAQKSRVRYLIPIVLLFVLPVMGFLIYDLVKPMVNPCEALFRQTQNSLDAKIELLNIKSEVSVQPHKIQELTERAQIVASNLQYCCTTLGGGERQPEDFIQCKTASSEFERGLDDIVKLKTQAEQAGGDNVPDTEALNQQLNATIEQTKLVSVSFNSQIATLQKEHQFERLEEQQLADLTITNQEAEPNDTLLMPNVMPLDEWIKGEIGQAGDADFYVIKTPSVHRDYVNIEFRNQSTTIAPQINIYNAGKSFVTHDYSGSNGADLSFKLVVEPDQTLYILVFEYRNAQIGKYLVKASMGKRFDQYEPNQNLLDATEVTLDKVIEANIMDGNDADYYRFRATDTGKLKIAFENRSTAIAPQMNLYNSNKSFLTHIFDGSNGANIELQYDVEQNRDYYLLVMEYRKAQSGQYRLTFDYLDE